MKHQTPRLVSRWHLSFRTGRPLLLGFALSLCGCDRPSAEEIAPHSQRRPVQGQSDLAQLAVETDLRRHDAALAIAFSRGDAEHRVAAATGLGRIDTDGALSLLQRGLSDPSPAVRAAVSFGLSRARLPLDAWIGAFAVETDSNVAALMTRDLGHALDQRRGGLLLRALHGPASRDACAGINRWVERDPELPADAIRQLLRLATGDDTATAQACLGVLGSLKSGSLTPIAASLLEHAPIGLRHADPQLRLAWARTLGTLGPAARSLLASASQDTSAAVAATAIELLARGGPANLPTFVAAFDPRLTRALSGTRTEADPPVLLAGLAAAHGLGDSAELVAWLQTVVDRLAPAEGPVFGSTSAALHCAAAGALDRVRKWPTRSLLCGGGQRPAWIGAVAAAEVLAHAEGSEALRATQLRRLYEPGDFHVKRAVIAALATLTPELAEPLLIEGLISDHPAVQTAAVETLAYLVPKLRSAGRALPEALSIPLRSAFQSFHVKHHVAGLLAWLSVVRMGRMRAELGGVTVLARSGLAPIRDDARALLAEWGHPAPNEPPEPIPNPIRREDLLTQPITVQLKLPSGVATLILEPTFAPVTMARVIHWLQRVPAGLEVSEQRPARHLLLTSANGMPSEPWRSEPSRAPLERGTVVVPELRHDGVTGSLLILLTAAPELEGHVAVIGRIADERSLLRLDQLALGDRVQPVPTP